MKSDQDYNLLDTDLLETRTPEGISKICTKLDRIAGDLENRYKEIQKIDSITSQINAGLMLDEVLENVYRDFKEVIPYNRIGFALIEEGRTVRARWAKSDKGGAEDLKIKKGYSAPLAGSSLETIIKTGQPRIINDLNDYLEKKPGSKSTKRIVDEGIVSSLTCPLINNGVAVGFMFFSSDHKNTYVGAHVDFFKKIASQLSVILEKANLVTKLAESKKEIEEQNAKLVELNELKNKFLGIAAHDLRNPIGFIMGAADLILAGSKLDDGQQTIFLQKIRDKSVYMLSLLNGLLDVSQIESGKLTLNLEDVNLHDLLTENVEQHQAIALRKETRILIEEGEKNAVIRIDPIRISQVMDNLISNAVKYSPPGSTVRICIEKTKSQYRINVKDEGPGITEEDRKRLFQDFARLSAQPTGGEMSTGLGLAIARRVIEAHGGDIGVETIEGGGSIFWFTIPI